MNRLWWSLVCVLALGVTSACDDNGDGDTDAGPDTSTDAGGEDETPVVLASVLDDEGELTDQVEPDFSCTGTRTEPAGAGEATFTIQAVDFQNKFAVAGLTVQFFPDNEPTADGSCPSPCQEVTTDASGTATVTDEAGSWYAYRVIGGSGTNVDDETSSDFLDVVQVNEEAPAEGETATLNVVRTSTRDTIALVLGTSVEAGMAVVTGEGSDCMARPLENATLRVFDSAGEIETGFTASGPREFYFSGTGLPAGSREMTNFDGLYGTVNIPLPADGQLRLELWGVTTAGGEPEMLGCESVQVEGDTLAIINLGPLRADGPSGCSGS